jgi:hypothetical protein
MFAYPFRFTNEIEIVSLSLKFSPSFSSLWFLLFFLSSYDFLLFISLQIFKGGGSGVV